MHKIGDDTVTADPITGEWTEGGPGGTPPATIGRAAWLNSVQRELINVLSAASVVPSLAADDQLLVSLKRLFSQVVNTVAVLRTIPPDATRTMTTKCHTNVTAGGGMHFYAVTGAAPGTYVHNNGTIIVPTGGDGSAAWLAIHSGILTPRRFGAIGDGVAVDLPALQAMFTVAIANKIPVNLESGNYLINARIDVTGGSDLYVYGAGINNTKITTNSATADVFYSSSDDRYMTFRDFSVTSSVAKTAGTFFNMLINRRSTFYRLKLTEWFNGFRFPKAEMSWMNECFITKPSGAGTAVFLGQAGSAGELSGFIVNNCFLRGCNDLTGATELALYGIESYDADAIYMINTDIGGFVTNDMLIAPTNRSANHHFLQNYFDATKTGACVRIAGAGVKSQITFAADWIASAGKQGTGNIEAVGLHVTNEGTYSDINVDNLRVYNNSGTGVLIEATNFDCTWVGGSIRSNGNAAATNKNGFKWAPVGVSSIGPKLTGVNFSGNALDDISVSANGRNYSVVGGSVESVSLLGALSLISGVFDTSSNTVASATTMTVPPTKKFINATGTTNIAGITATFADHEIVLKFNDVLTVLDSSQNLQLAGNFTVAANSTLHLICDGATWWEIARTL